MNKKTMLTTTLLTLATIISACCPHHNSDTDSKNMQVPLYESKFVKEQVRVDSELALIKSDIEQLKKNDEEIMKKNAAKEEQKNNQLSHTNNHSKALKRTLRVGDNMTEFTLQDGITRAAVSFNKDILEGAKITALLFMATSDSASKNALNLLDDLANKYGDDFKAYAIVVDTLGTKTVPTYDALFGFNARYLLDPDYMIPHRFGFTYVPSLALIDQNGQIFFLKGGFVQRDADQIIKAVKDGLK
ncbi:TlpA family protein disulfide reductase [Thermodesulfobacteriota bacterium]